MLTIDAVLAEPLRAAQAAGRALGVAGLDLPEELLAALPLATCHLPWAVGRPTPAADRWLESSFAPWTRPVLQDWADGRFDGFEAVVFSRGDDSAQRLYYYIAELQRRRQLGGPEPLIFDIARIRRATSLAHTVAAVRELASRFGADAAALARGIATINARRRRLAALQQARAGHGSHYERMARASLYAPLESLELGVAPPQEPLHGRVLLAGSVPPDDRLHRAVEAAGWSVTGEDHELSLRRLGPELAEAGDDPALAIGRHAWQHGGGARAFFDRAAVLLEALRHARADAVILWLIEEDEAPAWHVPAQRAALAAAGIPALVLTRRRWDASDGAAGAIAGWLETLPR